MVKKQDEVKSIVYILPHLALIFHRTFYAIILYLFYCIVHFVVLYRVPFQYWWYFMNNPMVLLSTFYSMLSHFPNEKFFFL